MTGAAVDVEPRRPSELEGAKERAAVLAGALPWLRRFAGSIVVVKYGGNAMTDDALKAAFAADMVFLRTVGLRPVVVHGGGAAIDRAMDAAGLVPRKIKGRRYTDDATLKIVEQVLAYETNEHLAGQIEELGGRAMPLNFRSTNVLFGERITLPGEGGEPIDLGHVGQVTRVDRTTIENLCYAGQVPVIPSMALDESTGGKLNVNADTAATAVATALGAEKLMYMSDVNGVRRDKNDANSIIHSLTDREARELIKTGVIDSGMIPKVEACLETLDRGVRKVHIIDGRLRHSLLLEIYTTSGVGTELVKAP